MKYKNCIFDLDGTILDTLEDLKNSVNYALGQKNYPLRTLNEVRSFIGDGIAMLIRRAVPENTAESEITETVDIFKSHYFVHLNDNTCPYDGILNMLSTLKSMGVNIGVVTNKSHEAAQELVRKYFNNLVDVTIGQRAGVPTKPDPASLFEAMNLLGAKTENTLFLGDSDTDIYTAHNGKVDCVGVTWGFRDKDVLISAGADYIVDTPYEIIKIIG